MAGASLTGSHRRRQQKPLRRKDSGAGFPAPVSYTQLDVYKRQELAARNHGVDIQYVEAETVYTLGESSLTIYPPGDVEGDNEPGLAVLCTCLLYTSIG